MLSSTFPDSAFHDAAFRDAAYPDSAFHGSSFLLQREIQELRTRTKREQRLVLSAWYDMGVQLQRRTTASSGLSQGGLAGDVPSSPVSWLNQQRKNAVERLSRGSVRRD